MLKHYLIVSCALALVLGTLPHHAHAMDTPDEDEISSSSSPMATPEPPFPFEELTGVPRAHLLHYLTPGEISNLLEISKILRQNTAAEQQEAMAQLEELRAIIHNPASRFAEKFAANQELPVEEKTQHLRTWAQHKGVGFSSSFRAAKALPADDPVRNDMLRTWAQQESFNAETQFTVVQALAPLDPLRIERLTHWVQDPKMPLDFRLQAALALPPEQQIQQLHRLAYDPSLTATEKFTAVDKMRIEVIKEIGNFELLRSLATDYSLGFSRNLQAAMALPERDAFRNELLRTWAKDRGLFFWHRLPAAAALPMDDPERNELLRSFIKEQGVYFSYRVQAAEALPLEERNQLLRTWAQTRYYEQKDRIMAAKAMTPGPERDEILRNLMGN